MVSWHRSYVFNVLFRATSICRTPEIRPTDLTGTMPLGPLAVFARRSCASHRPPPCISLASLPIQAKKTHPLRPLASPAPNVKMFHSLRNVGTHVRAGSVVCGGAGEGNKGGKRDGSFPSKAFRPCEGLERGRGVSCGRMRKVACEMAGQKGQLASQRIGRVPVSGCRSVVQARGTLATARRPLNAASRRCDEMPERPLCYAG